ncbi:class I SAM-dependent methyltransferase [Salinactinospora qingdaonensis]|uniref:Class I SAM-dependent methyltransferase n=1 Tax=Salinactinospora qingdaonensis TaxID=702744 RepID=A0ABP7G5X3_9ACTN
MPHEHTTEHASEEEFWDAFYSESERVWSGKPNAALVREVAGMRPGSALDLGCGEGADAVWLARQGWQVTAVDISRAALERAARHAAEAGAAERIDYQRHDLAASFPAGVFDLVSAHFLHSPGDMPREQILRSAAAAVAPGGVLLIVGHAAPPGGQDNPHADMHLPTPREVLDSLDLEPQHWEVLRSEEHETSYTDREGNPATRTDNTLKLRRR